MSNQVTNLDIEDVLSSIRRLVAEGDKLRSTPPKSVAEPREAQMTDPLPLRGMDMVAAPPVHAVPPSDRTPVADADSADDAGREAPKFVLTPALRVAEPRPSTVRLWEEAGDDPVPAARTAPERADRAVVPPGTSPEPFVLLSPEVMVGDPVTKRDSETDLAKLTDPALDPAPRASGPVSPAAPTVESRSRLAATIAELEAAITAKHDEWEPDGSEVTPVMDWASETAEPAFLSARQGSNRAAVEEAEELPEWPGADDSGAELRADGWVDAQEDDRKEDDGQEDDGQGEQDDWLAARAEDASGHLGDDLDRAEPLPSDIQHDAGRADDAGVAALSEDQILDEEALRNLVVEIVRQELQGALGERITRNVRKLVRREIYRILSSQDFD